MQLYIDIRSTQKLIENVDEELMEISKIEELLVSIYKQLFSTEDPVQHEVLRMIECVKNEKDYIKRRRDYLKRVTAVLGKADYSLKDSISDAEKIIRNSI